MSRSCYLLSIALTIPALGCSESIPVGPILAVDRLVHEFPAEYTGKTTATFVLRNAGDEILTIREVQSSCGCATPKLATKLLNPNGHVDLAVHVTRPSIGVRTSLVTVVTDSAQESKIVLQLICHASTNQPRILDVAPRRIILDNRFGNDDPVEEILLTTVERKDRQILASSVATCRSSRSIL